MSRWSNSLQQLGTAMKQLAQGNFKGARVAFMKGTPPVTAKGTTDSCPREIIDGRACLTASAGFSTFCAGARFCYNFRRETTSWEYGWGIGNSTGISGG